MAIGKMSSISFPLFLIFFLLFKQTHGVVTSRIRAAASMRWLLLLKSENALRNYPSVGSLSASERASGVNETARVVMALQKAGRYSIFLQLANASTYNSPSLMSQLPAILCCSPNGTTILAPTDYAFQKAGEVFVLQYLTQGLLPSFLEYSMLDARHTFSSMAMDKPGELYTNLLGTQLQKLRSGHVRVLLSPTGPQARPLQKAWITQGDIVRGSAVVSVHGLSEVLWPSGF